MPNPISHVTSMERPTVIPDLIRDPSVVRVSGSLRYSLVFALCMLLSACGFQLREKAELPPEMQQTQILQMMRCLTMQSSLKSQSRKELNFTN